MWFTSILGSQNPGRPSAWVGARRRCRPQVEALEQRLVPSFTPAPPVAVGTGPISVAVGDFNGDGKPDLAVPNNNSSKTVSIRLGTGAGGFTAAPDVTVGTQPRSVAVGDFNGDGKPDLAAANQNSKTVSIRLGNGDGTFTSAP